MYIVSNIKWHTIEMKVLIVDLVNIVCDKADLIRFERGSVLQA